MTYLIATEIRGFNYWVKVKGVVPKKTKDFDLVGLKNNATEFFTIEDANRVLKNLISDNPLNVIPYQ